MTAEAEPLRFELRTSLLSDGDACLSWLRRRHSHFDFSSDAHLVRLQNDISACAAHRWTAFSHPSPLHAAAPFFPHGAAQSPVEARVEANRVIISADANAAERAEKIVEPSRCAFAHAVRRREERARDLAISSAGGPRGPLRRAEFGGYIAPATARLTRFLFFPQRLHDARLGGKCPQEYNWALRGTVASSNSSSNSGNIVNSGFYALDAVKRVLRETSLCVSFAQKFASGVSARWKGVGAIDALRVDAYLNHKRTERALRPDASAVQTVGMRGAGVSAHFFDENPRKSVCVGSSYDVAHESARCGGQPIASLTFAKSYDSAAQRFASPLLRSWAPRAVYHVSCAGLTGVECTAGETLLTFFGRLSNTSWIELPIFSRFVLRLRQQSAVVMPFARPAIAQTENNGAHRLFWATQGPRWEPQLVRGFADTHSSVHHARRWFALFSAEFIAKTTEGEEQWPRPNAMLFANACFVDSFAKPPRASVGFSLTGKPRRTIDMFNAIVPSAFECSFNWRVHFGNHGVELASGVSQGASPSDIVVELSPLESFRHVRCGLTWKL